MKRLAALVFSLAATSFAAPAPIAGNWTIAGDVSGYPVNETCTLAVDADNKVTGSCSLAEKSYDVKGTLDGKKIVFSHGGEYQGQALVLTWTGTLADDGILSGTIDVQPLGYPGTFTGTKAEDKPAAK